MEGFLKKLFDVDRFRDCQAKTRASRRYPLHDVESSTRCCDGAARNTSINGYSAPTPIIACNQGCYSPDDDDYNPARGMLHSWLFCIMMPAAVLAWASTKRWTAVVGSTVATPALAILQGTIGILTYRLYFGDAPLPLTPSHGVVVVRPVEDNNGQQQSGEESVKDVLSGQNSIRFQSTAPGFLTNATGGLLQSAPCSSSPRPALLGEGTPQQQEADRLLLQAALAKQPIRLLVIGDSLAVGVGQSREATPIMPEVIARTISKQLGGRVVYWTCHGSPGASAGWIVRELERGVNYLRDKEQDNPDGEDLECLPTNKVDSQSSCSETDDDSSSDEGSSSDVFTTHSGVILENDSRDSTRSLSAWRQRLAQHRKRFDPHFLGPYDVAVVLTGSNDLKSAFFPFLLTGEDAEFRRQAQKRGGSYNKELRRLLATLNRRMRIFRETVGHAAESVLGKVEETVDYITHPAKRRNCVHSNRMNDQGEATHDPLVNSASASKKHPLQDDRRYQPSSNHFPAMDGNSPPDHIHSGREPHFPLVVLPGMPSRALPIFRNIPLRWLAIPIVDIMDMHKRDLARSHPGQVLFVKAPSNELLDTYGREQGEFWEERVQENTVLQLRDIKKRQRNRIQSKMQVYYSRKARGSNSWLALLSGKPSAPGLQNIFSVDQVHPTDEGYDIWGRYIGRSIVQEWQKAHRQ